MLIKHIVLLVPHFFNAIEVHSKKMHGYIVGGSDVSIVEFPHSVFLAISCVSDVAEEYACGGSIINQNFILTAAHCFETCDFKKSMVVACVGAANYTKAETYRVESIVNHENYTSKLLQHDICLLKLRKPIVFSKNVRRVSIMKRPPHFDFAEVAGWGLINEVDYTESLTLKKAVQKVYPVEKCKDILGYIPPNSFCANSVEGYAAEGDSGSALMIHKYIQIGIVSYKEPKVSVSLVVYVNVSLYHNWIQKTMYSMTCNAARK